MRLLTRIASLLDPKPYSGPLAPALEILVLQPTPFCNIDCDYCYLGNRNNTRRMTHDVMKGAVRFVLDGGLVSQRLSIVWHAGEPLVLPVSYYMEAFAAIEEEVRGRCEVSHSFQTNGTLISDSWCEFMKTQNMRIGL